MLGLLAAEHAVLVVEVVASHLGTDVEDDKASGVVEVAETGGEAGVENCAGVGNGMVAGVDVEEDVEKGAEEDAEKGVEEDGGGIAVHHYWNLKNGDGTRRDGFQDGRLGSVRNVEG